MRKRYVLLSCAVIVSLLVVGCGNKNKEPQTEHLTLENETTATVPIQQQTQAQESETEKVTEPPETEMPEKSIDELRDIFKDRGHTGKMQYEIITTEGKQTGNGCFYSNEGAFEIEESGEAVAYAYDDASYIKKKSGGWAEGSVIYKDLFHLFKKDQNASISEVSDMDGTRIYKIGLSDTDQATGEAILPVNMWYNELEPTKSAVLYYLDDAGNLKRVDISVAFTGLKDDTYVEGKYNCVFFVDGLYDDVPEISEEILKEIYPDYTAGTLTDTEYKNELFDFKMEGKGFLTFDTVKTEAMNEDYKAKGLGYVQEAVGNCEGGILSISSDKFSSASSVADALTKYLKNCRATDIGVSETVQLNERDATRCSAKINDTATYTYCFTEGGRILFYTIYYKDETIVDSINACVYRMWEDPYWEEASWMLENAYTIYTPKNYTIDLANSSDFYLCMKKGSLEVNTFAMNSITIDGQLTKDLETSEKSIPEEVSSEDIEVNGQYAKYAVISEKAKGNTYYTYELLQQAGEDVLKYFVVSLNGDEDYKDELISIASTMVMISKEKEPGTGEDVDGAAGAENETDSSQEAQ